MAEKHQTKPSRKVPKELVAIDFGTSALKVVRFRRVERQISILGADLLPAVDLAAPEASRKLALELPKSFLTNYAALACTGERGVLRMIGIPALPESPAEMDKVLREHIGLDASFRLAYFSAPPVKGRETRVLTVALPESDVAAVLARVPSGPPAPCSLELAGLAALNACVAGPTQASQNEAACVIECGARVSVMGIFNKGVMLLARKLEVGGDALREHIQKQFNVDAESAQSFITEGALDISASIKQVMEPFLRQLIISRDFVERQENCRISSVYLSGGMCLNNGWVRQVEQTVGMPVRLWNPFEGLVAHNFELQESLKGQECRFAAAIGAGWGTLQSI